MLVPPGAYPRRKHLKGTSIELALALPSNSKTWLERVSKDKPSSLLGLVVGDEGKKFYITLTPGLILEIFDVLTKFKNYQLPFHKISIFFKFKRSKIPYLKLVVSHCNNLSFCQCAMSSIVIFYLVISSACHFINFSFNSEDLKIPTLPWWWVISSINLSFC